MANRSESNVNFPSNVNGLKCHNYVQLDPFELSYHGQLFFLFVYWFFFQKKNKKKQKLKIDRMTWLRDKLPQLYPGQVKYCMGISR